MTTNDRWQRISSDEIPVRRYDRAMADQYLQQLDRVTEAAGADLIPISDDPSGAGRLKAIIVDDLVPFRPPNPPAENGQVAAYNADGSFAGWTTPVHAGGLPGGQTLHGGTGPAETLTLMPTSHATRGIMRIGGAGRFVFDDSAVRFGLGTTAPSARLHCQNGTIQVRHDQVGETALISVVRGGVRRWSLFIDEVTDGQPNDGALYWSTDGIGATYAVRPTAAQTTPTFAVQSSAGTFLAGYHTDGNWLTELSTAASTLGSVVRRLPIYDAAKSLLGYIPIYDSIN